MGDDRSLDDMAEALKKLTAEQEDLKSTVLARVQRRPTGTVEIAIRATPAAGTLFLDGAVVSRATYADLWAWAQDAGAVVTGGFTVGDGSTTFGLPNLKGRVIVGVGTLGADTYALGAQGGAAFRTLTEAQMPSHLHDLTGGGGTAYGVGDHGGHNSGGFGVAAGSAGATAANGNTGNGAHSHDVQTAVYSLDAGSDQPFDNRPPYAAWNYAVWT